MAAASPAGPVPMIMKSCVAAVMSIALFEGEVEDKVYCYHRFANQANRFGRIQNRRMVNSSWKADK